MLPVPHRWNEKTKENENSLKTLKKIEKQDDEEEDQKILKHQKQLTKR